MKMSSTNEIVLKEFAGKSYNGCKYYFQPDDATLNKISTKGSYISIKQTFKVFYKPILNLYLF